MIKIDSMIYNVHHLHCGSFCPVCAPLFGQQGWTAHLICHCLLVETDHGLVLIDTGIGLQDYLHTKKRVGTLLSLLGQIEPNLQLTAIRQIEKLGFHPNDVRHIFVTHLDFDHAGGISDFPQATVHVLSSEYQATQSFSFKSKLRYKSVQFKDHRHWNFVDPRRGASWFNLQQVQALNLFQDEILMIPLEGHSKGHCGIAIKRSSGWMLFCGDAYFSHLELNPNNKLHALDLMERILAENNQQRVSNLKRLQHIAQYEPQIELISAHDPFEFARYQSL